VLEYEVIWGHIDILVVVVRRLSRRWKVKTLLAGPSPTSPMKAEITISPISNTLKPLQEKSDSASHLAFTKGRRSQGDAFTTFVMRGSTGGRLSVGLQ
jgi:hypothetical protein